MRLDDRGLARNALVDSFGLGMTLYFLASKKHPVVEQHNHANWKDILAQDQLTKIMIEFYMAEAKLNNYSIPYDSANKLFIPFEESVLKKYGVSDSTLYKTYQYYFDHPKEMEKIYEIVIDSLSLRERKGSITPTPAN